jgi:hypothetical protein
MIDTAELLRAGFALQHETPDEALQGDSPLHDATPLIQAEDASIILYLERLVETLKRELEAARIREAKLLEREAELLALFRAQQEAQQRLLGEGRARPGFVTHMIASLRRLPPPGTTQP